MHNSFSAYPQTGNKLPNSRLCSFSLSIPDTLPINVDKIAPLCERGVCAKESEGSTAEVRAIATSIGVTIRGLLAVIVAVTLAVVIQSQERRGGTVDEGESSTDIGDIVETMTAFEASDHYVSQENTDQVPLVVVVEEKNQRLVVVYRKTPIKSSEWFNRGVDRLWLNRKFNGHLQARTMPSRLSFVELPEIRPPFFCRN
jgi:hypothetical protein